MASVERRTSNVERRNSNVERRTSKLERRNSNVETRTSKLERRTSNVERRTSKLERRTSNVERRASSVERRNSNVETRTSSVERRASSVETRTSKLERRNSNVETRTSKLERRTSNGEPSAGRHVREPAIQESVPACRGDGTDSRFAVSLEISMPATAFRFETLDVYRLSVSIARWMHATRWPAGMTHLKDQGTRAADSIVLNLAEGLSRGGKPGANHLRIAMGSAGEALACLDIADFPGCEDRREELRRVSAMLNRLRTR
jgi:four helix bundle protein